MSCDCCEGHEKCGCCSCSCDCSCKCDCGEHAGFRRHFATNEEQLYELESYKADLKKELQAVDEHINNLRK